MSGWRATSSGTVAVIVAGMTLAACGAGARQDASEPSGKFTVEVPTASFPTTQRLAEHAKLMITVRNAGNKTIPDVAVSLLDPRAGTSAASFGALLSEAANQSLASRSRPVWIIDRAPEPPPSPATDNSSCAYSCQSGGPGGATTAYSNTWALGALKPGQTATFVWSVTPVRPGSYTIQYQVAAGLNGKARAELAGGGQPTGTFKVTVVKAPSQSYVNDQGAVVATK